MYSQGENSKFHKVSPRLFVADSYPRHIVQSSFTTPPTMSTIALLFIMSHNSHMIMLTARNPPPNDTNIVLMVCSYESKKGDTSAEPPPVKVLIGCSIANAKLSIAMNIQGLTNLMVAIADFKGGSILCIKNCMTVHRIPLQMLANIQNIAPMTSNVASDSPYTVRNSPAEMMSTTNINPDVMGSIPNKYALITTKIGLLALSIV